MITKEDVLKAIDIIEEYQKQQMQKVIELEKNLEINKDTRSILILGLSTREINCLESEGITTIGELLAYDKGNLRRIRNLGEKSFTNINKKLKDFGIDTSKVAWR